MIEKNNLLHTQSRRAFLSNVGRAGLAAWLGLEFLPDSVLSPVMAKEVAPASTQRGIVHLRLMSRRLHDVQRFYAETMGFDTELSAKTLRIKTGGTVIEFDEIERDGENADTPYYHVAWAIPENKFAVAKAWLAARTSLLRAPDGRDEFHFRSVNRHAVYFADPAGNILELIARHNLKDARDGPFELADILYVNHAGLVVDDLQAAITQIRQKLLLDLRYEPTSNFAQMGDEYRHLVLVTRDRLWLPENIKPARVYETEIVLHGEPDKHLAFENYPYRISVRA
ncbi:hypothetical protein L0337_23925 [candidate division KSB1 bacterium]|nr:hypothetical protein [candidate division KSB1 bacterium]